MQIFAHVGPDDPLALHHILPMLAAAGSGFLAYLYLFWANVRKAVQQLRAAAVKLLRSWSRR